MSPGRGRSCWPHWQPTSGQSSPHGSRGCGVAVTRCPGGWEHVLCSSPKAFMPLYGSSNYRGSTWGDGVTRDSQPLVTPLHMSMRGCSPACPNEQGLQQPNTGQTTELQKWKSRRSCSRASPACLRCLARCCPMEKPHLGSSSWRRSAVGLTHKPHAKK